MEVGEATGKWGSMASSPISKSLRSSSATTTSVLPQSGLSPLNQISCIPYSNRYSPLRCLKTIASSSPSKILIYKSPISALSNSSNDIAPCLPLLHSNLNQKSRIEINKANDLNGTTSSGPNKLRNPKMIA